MFYYLVWIKNTIKFCYIKVDNADMGLMGVKAHDITAFAASKTFYGGISMDQIMQAYWKSHNTFTKFYLRGLLPLRRLHCSTAGDASFRSSSREEKRGARCREPPRRGVSEPSDTIERGLHPFKVIFICNFSFTCCSLKYLHLIYLSGVFFFPIFLRT